MTKWRTFIDPSVGDGQNTINGIIADGSTFGVGISDDLSVTGLSTFADNVNVNSDIYVQGDLRLGGKLKDGDNAFGTSGQVLSSDGTDTRWVNAGSLSAGAASLVAINDDSNTNADRFITFVDSSSGNNAVKTDAALKYNPSTNTVSLVGGSIQSQNASGTRVTLLDTDGSIEITRESGPFIDFKTSNSEDHDCRIQMENDGLTFTTGGNGSASKRIKLDTNGHLLPITDSAFDIGSNTARFRNIYADDFTGNLTGNTSGSSGSCTGNAASATILANTRTIGGVSFNGSANINLPGVNQAGNQNTSGNAATATVLETTRNFSISGEITANAQSFNGSGNVTLSATVDDNVIDEANLKISNSPTNGRFLQCNTGVSGGLTWAEVTLPTSNTLSGTTLASGITASSITSLGTLTGLSVNGNVSVTTGSISGNGSGLTNLGANRLSSGTVAADRLPKQESGISIVGNFGQWQGHNTYNNFNTEPTYWGWNYVNGTSNAPNTTSSQWYRCRLSLGSEYGKGTDSNDYSLEMALPRFSHSAAGVLHIRTIENGGEGSWTTVGDNASLITTGTLPDARLTSSSLFVTGMIMMYTGSTAPSGWAICNGQNGTPDLRDRFIVGAGSAYAVNNTGGAASVTLTTAQLPAHSHTTPNHNHSFSATTSSNTHNHTWDRQDAQNDVGYRPWPASNNDCKRTTANTGDNTHSHTVSGTTGNANPTTNNTGSGNSHENRPPYYALMFIMKL